MHWAGRPILWPNKKHLFSALCLEWLADFVLLPRRLTGRRMAGLRGSQARLLDLYPAGLTALHERRREA